MTQTIETLSWNGLTYTVKPFTLDTLFALYEAISNSMENGRIIRDMFGNSCKALLEGTTNEAKSFLATGGLEKSVLSSEDVEKAMEFKEKIDFFSASYTERGNALKKSAPDLTDKLTRKQAKASNPPSRKGTKEEPEHFG
jgi:hypothetical protein